MRCMSCLENFPRRKIHLCHGCKGWYCPECYEDHKPCNRVTDVKSDDDPDDNPTEDINEPVDDSKPGVWIIKDPATDKNQFDFWQYVA